MDHSWCSGLLKGDPDIAGTGVVSAIWLTSFASVVAGGILWYFTALKGESPNANETCQRVLRCAFMLHDTAFVTMLAVICSSIILIKSEPDTSLYHVFVARCLAQNCQNGLFCSVPFYEYRLNYRTTVGDMTRVLLLILSLVLWLYWTILCITEFEKWRPVTPSCFYDDSVTPGWYTTWMKFDLFWTPCGWTWYILEAWQRCEGFLKTTNAFVPKAPERIKNRWRRWYGYTKSFSRSRKLSVKSLIFFGALCSFGPYFIMDIMACLLVGIFVGPHQQLP